MGRAATEGVPGGGAPKTTPVARLARARRAGPWSLGPLDTPFHLSVARKRHGEGGHTQGRGTPPEESDTSPPIGGAQLRAATRCDAVYDQKH